MQCFVSGAAKLLGCAGEAQLGSAPDSGAATQQAILKYVGWDGRRCAERQEQLSLPATPTAPHPSSARETSARASLKEPSLRLWSASFLFFLHGRMRTIFLSLFPFFFRFWSVSF